MGQTSSGFDDYLKCNTFGAAFCGFNRGDQSIDGIDVSGATHFWDHDLVKAVSCLFQQVHHVAVPEWGVEAVDAYRQRFVAPIDGVDRLDDIGASGIFV